jgi:hypothetical protein
MNEVASFIDASQFVANNNLWHEHDNTIQEKYDHKSKDQH